MFDEQVCSDGGAGGVGGLLSSADVGRTAVRNDRRADSVDLDRSGESSWKVVDRALRDCARRQRELDAEEARWLVAAEQLQVHREVGCGSIHEYVERILGYGPRVARERLRVARALVELPAMSAALARGELCHSAVRELTRVATPATEAAWIDATRGKCLREIEEAVAGRERGTLPEDPDDGPPRDLTIELELSPSTWALYRDAVRHLEVELGERLTDDQAVALMCRAVLHGGGTESVEGADADDDGDNAVAGHGAEGEPSGDAQAIGAAELVTAPGHRPRYQIAITTCAGCKRGWHDAAGRSFAITAADLERASCDAELLGRVDGASPDRLTRTIPPATRRQVFRRDRGRCIVPGCRATRYLEVHHVVPRAVGGTHDPRGLALICSGHHDAIHAGRLEVSGLAPDFHVRRTAPRAPGTVTPIASRSDAIVERARADGGPSETRNDGVVRHAIAAIHQAGYTRSEATRAVQVAMSHVDHTSRVALEELVRAALRAMKR